MSSHSPSLPRHLLLLLPLSLASLIYLYLYPAFHPSCSFPLPPQHHHGQPRPPAAPFKLLVLADPQLEGDTSLPHPDWWLTNRLTHHWRAIKTAARRSTHAHSATLSSSDDEHDDTTLPPHATTLPTVLRTAITDLLLSDLPRSLKAARKHLDLIGNDFYLAHIYRTLHWWTQPTHVTVLGDLLGSQWIFDDEFQRRASRFWGRVFRGGKKVEEGYMATGDPRNFGDAATVVEQLGDDGGEWSRRIINVVGNHDVGYAGDISESRLARFERAFGRANYDVRFELGRREATDTNGTETEPGQRPSIHLINLNDLLFDYPALSPDLTQQNYDYINSVISRSPPVGDNTTFTLLLTHVPLHKPPGVCTDGPYFDFFDADDPWGRFREGGLHAQNFLTKHISRHGILQGVFGMSGEEGAVAGGVGRKGVILNGHDHTGCDSVHYVSREKSDVNNDEDELNTTHEDWSWKARKYEADNTLPSTTPHVREITMRSMMGEFGGNAGFLSLWYDSDPAGGGGGEWKYEINTCRFGIQHVWWGVHILAAFTLLATLRWIVLGRGRNGRATRIRIKTYKVDEEEVEAKRIAMQVEGITERIEELKVGDGMVVRKRRI